MPVVLHPAAMYPSPRPRALSAAALLVFVAGCPSASARGVREAPRTERATSFALDAGSAEAGPIDTSASDGDPMDAAASESDSCAPDTVDISPLGASAWTITTTHYSFDAETDQASAVEMARILEAAFPAFQAYFEATPPLAAGARLRVRAFANDKNYRAAMAADGITEVPSEAAGFFTTATKTAYLALNGNPYSSHSLLLHEATHQFHRLARVKGKKLPFWYKEGAADYLSRHDWNGKCLRIGTMSMLTQEDLPAAALIEATKPGFDLTTLVAATTPSSHAIMWALYRFLDTTHLAAFKAYRDAVDAGLTDPGHSFARLVGDPTSLEAPLRSWLGQAYEKMKPIYANWIHVAPGTVIGDSPVHFGVALFKATVAHFEVRYDVPKSARWSVGTLLDYADDKTYTAIVLESTGTLRTINSWKGTSYARDEGTAPTSLDGKTGSFAVDFAGSVARVTVNGSHSHYDLRRPPHGGLVVGNSRVLFHDITGR